jgi:protein-tyrosine phosphatase
MLLSDPGWLVSRKVDTPAIASSTFALLHIDLTRYASPSLLVSLAIIFCRSHINQETAKSRQIIIAGWSGIIVASNYLTGQNSMAILIGTLGAILSFYLFSGSKKSVKFAFDKNQLLLGLRYGFLSACFIGAATLGKGWYYLLYYPALSLFIVSMAYVFHDADFTHKHMGRIPFTSKCILGPYLAMMYMGWLYHCMHSLAVQRLDPSIYIGRRLAAGECRCLNQIGVTAILDLAPELSDKTNTDVYHYKNLPLLESANPSVAYLIQAVDFISEQVAQNRKIFIHCSSGYHRSALVIAAFYISKGKSVDAAIAAISKQRPDIHLPMENRQRLFELQQMSKHLPTPMKNDLLPAAF